MTTEQKYEAVAQAIRQELPRLMKFEEGCFIKHKKCNWKRKIIHINKEKIYMIEIDGFHPIDILSYKIKEFDKDKWEIIGKEPTILDVLEYMSELIFSQCYTIPDYNENSFIRDFNFSFFHSLRFEMQDVTDSQIRDTLVCRDWDFSKIYLKDQPEKIINFIYFFCKQSIV